MANAFCILYNRVSMRRKISSSLRIELIAVVLMTVVMTVLNSLHVLREWLRNPPDRLFAGITQYFADYFLYVSHIQWGILGGIIFAPHRFTNEPLPYTWIYWFYVLLGRIGGMAGLSPFFLYNAALILLVIGVILLWYYLCFRLFPTDRLARLSGFIAVLTASSFIDFQALQTQGILRLLGYFWFTPAPSFNRLGGVPHQLFQNILYMLLILLVASLINRWSMRKKISGFAYCLLAILTFFAATSNPIQIVVCTITVASAALLFFILNKRWNMSGVIMLAVMGIVALGGAGLTNAHFAAIPVYAVGKIWEATQVVPVTGLTFLYAVGPILFLIPFGVYPFLRRPDPLRILLVGYLVVSIVIFFSPIPQILGTAKPRWLSPVSYSVLAIIAGQGVSTVVAYAKRRKKLLGWLAGGTIALLYALLTVPALIHQIQAHIDPVANPHMLLDTDYNHIPKPTVEGLRVLAKLPTTPDTRVVLADIQMPIEILVPAFTDKTSFTGQPVHTLYPMEKESLRSKFYALSMTPDEARIFFRNHSIGYILSSAGHVGALAKTYPFLAQKYQNSLLTIFSTQ